MMFQCSLLSVFADDEYTYTVTFYAGNQGTFADGAGKIVMSNLKYGAFVSFDVQKDGVVTLNNSDKYYVKAVLIWQFGLSPIYVVLAGIAGGLVYTLWLKDKIKDIKA